MPVSMTNAVTPAPVALYVYELSSGRLRWSVRSMPHVAGDWVAVIETAVSAST